MASAHHQIPSSADKSVTNVATELRKKVSQNVACSGEPPVQCDDYELEHTLERARAQLAHYKQLRALRVESMNAREQNEAHSVPRAATMLPQAMTSSAAPPVPDVGMNAREQNEAHSAPRAATMPPQAMMSSAVPPAPDVGTVPVVSSSESVTASAIAANQGSSASQFSFHLISSLQAGADRGALLGLDDARRKLAPQSAMQLSTGGFAPLGFRCDDYIQLSGIDPEAKYFIENERQWLKQPPNINVRELIDRFGIVELPNSEHKVRFKPKDLANADACDVVIGFRAPVASSGAGTEQTVNYAVFGSYHFVEQFQHGKTAGGAIQRLGLASLPGWPAAALAQIVDLGGAANTSDDGAGDGGGWLEFIRGVEYEVLETFTHSTTKDEVRSSKKGKDCFIKRKLTQSELLQKMWKCQTANRSAIVFTLATRADSDAMVSEQIAAFLRRASKESTQPLRIMVTGATECVFPGTETRVRAIFTAAFNELEASKSIDKISNFGIASGIPEAKSFKRVKPTAEAESNEEKSRDVAVQVQGEDEARSSTAENATVKTAMVGAINSVDELMKDKTPTVALPLDSDAPENSEPMYMRLDLPAVDHETSSIIELDLSGLLQLA